MGAIAGRVLFRTSSKEPEEHVQRMLEVMHHRGQPGTPTTQTGTVFGTCGTMTEEGRPATDPQTGLMLAFSGVLFNAEEIRKALGGPAITDDAGLVLAVWKAWGQGGLPRIDGCFALAIWDPRTQQCFLARDRFGEAPLYHALHEGVLYFASEVRALLASGALPRRLDPIGLADYLRRGTVHAPRTLVQGIQLLPPGHLLRHAQGGQRIEQWYDPAVEAATRTTPPPHELHQAVREAFIRGVQCRMRPGTETGAFLSGGIDSSAVVAAMAGNSSHAIPTLTITFNEQEYDEARYARLVADRYGTRHTEVRLRPHDMLRLLPEALAAMDHPSVDGPNTWVAARALRQVGLKTAISGAGGDELFAGYDLFKRILALEQRRRWLPFIRPFRAPAASLARALLPGSRGWRLAELLRLPRWDVGSIYPIIRLLQTDRYIQQQLLVAPPAPDDLAGTLRDRLQGEPASRLGSISRITLGELATYVPDVLLRDTGQLAMAHGVQVYSPFLDRHLVPLVLSLPDEAKYPHTPKQLLTDSLAGLLPQAIIDRPKMGFTLPWEHWLRHELRPFCRQRIEALASRPQFNRAGVHALWEHFLLGRGGINLVQVWMLVALEEWLSTHDVA